MERDLDLERDLDRDLDFSLLAGEGDLEERFRSPFSFLRSLERERERDRERERLRDLSSRDALPRGDLLRDLLRLLDREALLDLFPPRSRDRLLERERDLERDLDLEPERRDPPPLALTRRIRLPLSSWSFNSSMARSRPSRERNSTTPSPRRSRCASLNVTSPTFRMKSFKSCHDTCDDRFSTTRRCSVRRGGGRRLRGGERRRKPG